MNGTDFLMFYEKYARFQLAEYLQVPVSQIAHVSKKLVTAPYDLEHNGLRYDVKFSTPVLVSKKKKALVWDFSLRKQKSGKRTGQNGMQCDYFILVGMKNGIPAKTFLVPVKEAPTNHIRISINGVSKYNAYQI